MNGPLHQRPRSRWTMMAAAAVVALGVAGEAMAGLLGTQVTAKLDSPNGIEGDATPVSLTDTVPVVSPGVEISAGNGTNIGGFLLTNTVSEFIDIDDLTITLRLLNGATQNAGTGYASGAQFVFSGLSIAGTDIIGASITSNAGFANFSNAWLSFDNTTDVVSLAIDTMLFSAATTADRFGDLVITLQTRQACSPTDPACSGGGGNGGGGNVPEPTSWALVGLALAGLGVTSRARRAVRAAR